MERLMPSILQNLRETNRRMGEWLDNIAAERGQPAVPTSEQMAAVLSELLRTGGWLRAQPLPQKADDPELHRELEQYRRHVQRLSELLPSIHAQLLAERARLEAQRARVRAAGEWARASRQTL
jgi:hypothetical protein